MHEIIFSKTVIKEIEKQAADIEKVTLEVGELAGIEPEELKETIEKLRPWKIEVNTKQALVRCDCGYEGKPEITQKLHDFVVYVCPKCKKIPEVIEGKDIKVIKIVSN